MKRKGLLILGLTAALTAGSGITALAAAGYTKKYPNTKDAGHSAIT